MVMQVYNSSPLEAEAGGSGVPGLSGLHRQTLPQNQDRKLGMVAHVCNPGPWRWTQED